jgi:gas vesicle protein
MTEEKSFKDFFKDLGNKSRKYKNIRQADEALTIIHDSNNILGDWKPKLEKLRNSVDEELVTDLYAFFLYNHKQDNECFRTVIEENLEDFLHKIEEASQEYYNINKAREALDALDSSNRLDNWESKLKELENLVKKELDDNLSALLNEKLKEKILSKPAVV